MAVRCVSDQSERLACHVTHINAAFTVCTQRALQRTGVVSVSPQAGCVCACDLNIMMHVKLFLCSVNLHVKTTEQKDVDCAAPTFKCHKQQKNIVTDGLEKMMKR